MLLHLGTTDLIKKGKLKELADYQQLRSNAEAYEHFCDEFLPCIVGKTQWSKEIYDKEISKIASVTDEAWALLLLENSWDLWNQIAKHEISGEPLPKEDCKKTKWTLGAISAGKYEGWGQESIPKYNDWVRKVCQD